jgi:hypothetical protein
MLKTHLHFQQYPEKCSLTIRNTNLPINQSHLLNCDWLQFSATSRSDIETCPKFLISIERAERGTLNYSRLYRATHLDLPGELFAEIQTTPHASFIPPNSVIVKIANRFLYSKELKFYVQTLCNELDLTFKHISRLDLALDFQEFSENKNLLPDQFFEKIASREFKMRSHKSIASPFRDDQNIITRGRRIRQLTFGSRRSPVYIVMYNKSMEMRQKKFKPYIVQSWEQSGFDKEKDTYRLEFSIKLKQDFIDKFTGETINKTDLSLLDKDNLQKIFKSYYYKHFRPVEADNERLQRCTPVNLFTLTERAFIMQELSEKKDSHIHTKSGIKNLVKRLLTMNIEEKEIMYDGLNYYLSELIHVHYLHQWFRRQYPLHVLPEYQPSPAVLGQQIELFKN